MSAVDLVIRLRKKESPQLDAKRTDALYEPSFCTWYAYHGAIDQQRAEQCAQKARDLGFGTFILDDGWAYEEDQRVGTALGEWHRWQGDWKPSKRKFPDFAEHIQRVRGEGMRYLLWFAPFLVGKRSSARKLLSGHLMNSWLQEGFQVADPRSEKVRKHLRETVVRLIECYGIDGFKVDYDYALLGPDQSPQGLGEAYASCVKELVQTAREIRCDFEWNLIPNRFAATAAQAMRCLDVPFDPESNRLAMTCARAVTGRAPLYYDPSLWTPEDDVGTVHRHMIPSLFCVPSLGAPIMDLPSVHLEAVRAWLSFYRRHQGVLNKGTFRATWSGSDYACMATRLGTQEIAAVFSEYPFRVAPISNVRVINGGVAREITVKLMNSASWKMEDAWGRAKGGGRMMKTGMHSLKVPPGSVAHIETA